MSIKSLIQSLILLLIISIIVGVYLKYFDTNKDIVEEVKSRGVKGDIFLTMGAGNIWRYAEELGKHYND